MGKKNKNTKNSNSFLYEYLNAFSPVGLETEGQKVWIEYIKQFTSNVNKDAYGTAWGIYSSTNLFNLLDRKKVVIEAHCDEIAWIITNIESDGFIRVKRHGGSDNMIAASKSVIIHTHDGQKVKGFFGSPAIHVRDKNVTMGPEQHDLWLDVGVDSSDRVKELGIEV